MKAITYGAKGLRIWNISDATLIPPGRVFERAIGIYEVADGYRATNLCEVIKIMINFWKRNHLCANTVQAPHLMETSKHLDGDAS
ncbi:hypothetical protein ACMHYO_08620 [Allopusillimonas ginsengisoli]|uniref:hypothetical protein n=1 Tax=Allopusillimonas ginsengisoli TaxID=453575 RepID=UPI0039C39ACE